MMHVKVLGAKLNLSSAIFGCVLNRCYKRAGRCEGLIENRSCSQCYGALYCVYASFSLYSDYICVITTANFQTAVQGLMPGICAFACSLVDTGLDKLLINIIN